MGIGNDTHHFLFEIRVLFALRNNLYIYCLLALVATANLVSYELTLVK